MADSGESITGEASRGRVASFDPTSSTGRLTDDGGDVEQNETSSTSLLSGVRKFGVAFWLLALGCVVVYGDVIPFNSIASTLLMERNYFKVQPDDQCALRHAGQCEGSVNPPNKYCRSKWFQPPLPVNVTVGDSYYATVAADDVICVGTTSETDPWKGASGCTKDYCDAEDLAIKQADTIMRIPYFMSAVLSPILGGVVDRFGGRAIICVLSAVTLCVVHALLGYVTSLSPVYPLIGQGLAYSMFAAALWPSVPYLVPKQQIGLAYGVVTAVQNAGLAGVPLIIALVYNESGDKYIPNVEVLFVGLALLGTACGLTLNIIVPSLNMQSPPKYEDQLTQEPRAVAEARMEKEDGNLIAEILRSN